MKTKEPLGPPWLSPDVDIDAADRVIVKLTLPPLRGEAETTTFEAPLNSILTLQRLVTSFGDDGPRMALDAALLGITIRIQQPSPEEYKTEIGIIQQLIQHIQLLSGEIPEQISYEMLRRGRWTRPEAAKNATNLLGRKIEPDAWRKRVDAYAVEKRLPKINLPKGRRKKSEN